MEESDACGGNGKAAEVGLVDNGDSSSRMRGSVVDDDVDERPEKTCHRRRWVGLSPGADATLVVDTLGESIPADSKNLRGVMNLALRANSRNRAPFCCQAAL